MKSSPIPMKRIGYGRTTIFYIDGMVDFKRDNWKTMGEMALPFSWVGRTFFRVYGPYENDYNCESVEIREAITDYEFVGKEKEGESMITLYAPHSIKGVFIEDNQATIRILENGKSPTFRHTDKTQRVNLSWLEEQFKRRWYKLVHGPTQLQAADIFTKPFANSEKWKNAIKLLAITDKEIESKPQDKTARRPSIAAERTPCTGGPSALPDAKRLIIEICCSSESKLSDTDRKWAVGCTVLQFTEDNDLNSEENRKQIAKEVNEWDGDITPLAWISLPCTGGTPWTHINTRHPKAREKVLYHIRIFHKLWQSMLMFFDIVEVPVKIALEWPKGCRYWTLPKVERFLKRNGLHKYNFDGCALGVTDQRGEPIKKPWTVATNHDEIGKVLSKYKCTCKQPHSQGRGIALKETESYTYRMTDCIHRTLFRSVPKQACIALSFRFVPLSSLVSAMLARAVEMARKYKVDQWPLIKTRIENWEARIRGFRGSLAVATWNEPDVLLVQLDGLRIPLNELLEPTIGGGNCSGSYASLVEMFKLTPEGYLADVPYPPGGAVDVLLISDSSFALVKSQKEGKTSAFHCGELLSPWKGVRGVYTKLLWGKGLGDIVDAIPLMLDHIHEQNAENPESA